MEPRQHEIGYRLVRDRILPKKLFIGSKPAHPAVRALLLDHVKLTAPRILRNASVLRNVWGCGQSI